MFTGIIETIGTVKAIEKDRGNFVLKIESEIASELHVDQSLSHNGVCLTVTKCNDTEYEVCVVNQTLSVTNLKLLKTGDEINLERALKIGDRLDGHFVQGHVDCIAKCLSIIEEHGSKRITFLIPATIQLLYINKGSITLNGVSLTIANNFENKIEVVIIPYTFDNTTFHSLKVEDFVNVEFDILGKYIHKLVAG